MQRKPREPIPGRRTQAQNRALWSKLQDISRQLRWPVNGELCFLNTEEWKIVFSAAWKKEMRMAAGIDGGLVAIGVHTSRMTEAEMSDLLTLITEFGDRNRVTWSDPNLPPPEVYKDELETIREVFARFK